MTLPARPGDCYPAAVAGRVLLFLACASVAGCLSPRQPTQVTVNVEAQSGVRSEAVSLEVVVRAGPRGDLAELPDDYFYDEAPLFPRDFTLVPLGGDLSRIFEIEATAYDAEQRVITVARLRGGFVEHQPRTLRLTLEDACRGIVCPSGSTCRSARCVELVDPVVDGGVEDLDGGVPTDAPRPPCTDDASCDDGVYCNGIEICKDGTCQLGEIVSCDDGIPCTEDVCSGSGCNHLPNDDLCSGGPDPRCDVETGCQFSTCTEATCFDEGCTHAECSGTTCMRTGMCGGATPFCCGTTCVAPGCDDGDGCTRDYCDDRRLAGPICANEPILGSCEDGDACTVGDTCSAGGCSGGTPLDCNDSNPCTDDTCDGAVGCQRVPDDTNPYSDSNRCTVGDRCSGGVAMAGEPMDCSDPHACTADSCVDGTCVHIPRDGMCTEMPMGRCNVDSGCQYGSVCTTGTGGTCVPANPCELVACDGATCTRTARCPGQVCCNGVCCGEDADPCTTAMCVSGSCQQVSNAAACDDTNSCTTGDVCSAGTCRGTAITCAAAPQCRTNTCMGGTCVAGNQPDGTPCNADGTLCTADACSSGVCVAGAPRSCSDGLPCTDDRCNPATGACEFPPTEAGSWCGGPFGACNRMVCDGGGLCVPGGCEPPFECCGGNYCALPGDCFTCVPPMICPEV